MKGIIVYSSKTGNTKKMAEVIHKKLNEIYDVDLAEIKEKIDIEKYDFALIGGWIDRALPNTEAIKLIKETSQNNLGIFITMGAMPDSKHGEDVSKNLEKLLETRNSIGYYKCPGLVDPKLIENLKKSNNIPLPKEIKDNMIEASLNSRYATEKELEYAACFFKERILDLKNN